MASEAQSNAEQSSDNGDEAKLKSVNELLSMPASVMSSREVLSSIVTLCKPSLNLGTLSEERVQSMLREIRDIVTNTGLGATTRLAAVSAKLNIAAAASANTSAAAGASAGSSTQAATPERRGGLVATLDNTQAQAEEGQKQDDKGDKRKDSGYFRITADFGVVSWKGDGDSDIDPLLGPGAGVYYGIPVSKRHPHILGLGFHWQMAKRTHTESMGRDDVDFKMKSVYMEIPATYSYRANPGGGKIFLEPTVGLNFKINLTCENVMDDGEDSIDLVDDEFSKFQIGARVGMAFTFSKLCIAYYFQPDFNKLVGETSSRVNQVHIGIDF